MILKIIAMMLLSIGLLSCSEPQSNTEQTKNKVDSSDQKHMFSDQEKMLQKAKDTEKLIKEADEKRRKALKEQGG